VSILPSDQCDDVIVEEDDSNSRSELLFTPNAYSEQKDEFYDDKKKNIKLFLVKARRCDPPYDFVLGDKRRTLNALFSEIQVLLLLLLLLLYEKTNMGNKTYKIPEKLEKPTELSLSIIRLIKKIYDEEKIKMENEDENYENIKAMDNINPYSFLISIKGSLALVVSDDDYSENNNKKENDESKFSVGFEKVRFDAPEVKMGFFLLII
jgi:hypothetical protein